MLKPATRRAVGNAQTVGDLDVEAAGPALLDQRIAEPRDAVVDAERLDGIAVSLEPVSGRELDEVELVGELAEDTPERVSRS